MVGNLLKRQYLNIFNLRREKLEHLVFIIILILIVAGFQLKWFRSTYNKIKILGAIFHEEHEWVISKDSIFLPDNPSMTLYKILTEINKYLHSTRTPDFGVIKDIVERYIQVQEDEINHTLTVPLYLGLIGTIIGVIFGLFKLDLTSEKIIFAEPLIDGVKVAMLASALGLGLTILNSALFYNREKYKLEKSKNEFYQRVLSDGNLFSDVLKGLRDSLGGFNDSLNASIAKLEEIWDDVITSNKQQKEIVSALKDAKVEQMIKANVKIFKELNESVEKLEKFNEYVAQMSLFAENFAKLEDLAKTTQSFQNIAENINKNTEICSGWIEFLNENFKTIDDVKSKTEKSVENAETSMNTAMVTIRSVLTALSVYIKDFNVEIKTSIDEIISTPINTAASDIRSGFINIGSYFATFKETMENSMNTAASTIKFKYDETFSEILNKMEKVNEKILDNMEKGNEKTKDMGVEDFIGKKLDDVGKKIEEYTKKETKELGDRIANTAQTTELENLLRQMVQQQMQIIENTRPRSFFKRFFGD
jgi:hypothetical protein